MGLNITYIPPTKNVGESVADINKNFEELANAVDTIDSGSTEGIKELQDTITAVGEKVDTKADKNHTHSPATTSANGLMSSADKAKLDGIATGANAYVLPTASATTLGGVKTTSTVLSATGHTPCPIISGVPYYKDTTYSSLKNPYALTLQGNGTTLTNGTYDGSEAKTVNITPSSIGAATGRVLTSSGGSVGSGKMGYIGFSQLKVQAAYSDKIIEFKLVRRRSDTPCYVSARLASSADTDPDLVSLVVFGTNYEVFAHKTDVGTWVLYAKKSATYDNIDVVGLTDNSSNNFEVEITYPNTFITEKPTSNVVDAVYGYTCGICESCTGNATSASTVSHSYSNDNGWYQMLLGTATTGTVTETPVGNSSILANPSTGKISAKTFHSTVAGKLLYSGTITSLSGSLTISSLTDYPTVLLEVTGTGATGKGFTVSGILPIAYLAKGNSITLGGIPSATRSYDQGTSSALTSIDGTLTVSIDMADTSTLNLVQSDGSLIGTVKIYSI